MMHRTVSRYRQLLNKQKEHIIGIIGGGVVGLSVAKHISDQTKDQVILIEQNSQFGMDSSSRNSEVIHSAVYYPKGSLKSHLCKLGNQILYTYDQQLVKTQKIGKLIISTSSQEDQQLKQLYQQTLLNGAIDPLYLQTKQHIRNIDQHVDLSNIHSAIYFKQSGIVCSHSLMQYYETASIDNGVIIIYNHKLNHIKYQNKHYILEIEDKNHQSTKLECQKVINCAGLQSDQVASLLLGQDWVKQQKLEILFKKGLYYRVKNKKKYADCLIYPLPTKICLGVHTCPDLQGNMRVGPLSINITHKKYPPDYTISELEDQQYKQKVFGFVSKYLDIDYDDLEFDSSGVQSDTQYKDFYIKEESQWGYPGFINLIGISSPGLTSSPAIGQYVAQLTKQ